MNQQELLQVIKRAAEQDWTTLDLSGKRLTCLPPEIGRLTNLRGLYVGRNRLTALPPEIGQLKNLERLYVSENQLTALPPEIGQLKNLERLYVSENQLTALPPEIGRLTNLWALHVWENQLTSLPPGIGQLKNVEELYVRDNRLTFLPPEIGQLKNVQDLYVARNRLTSLPPEIGQLKNLRGLVVNDNQLTSLPPEIGQLKNLHRLSVDHNPLVSPPPDVVEQGTEAVLAYLRDQLRAERRQWVSKLLLVGEGAVGKTHLLRTLRGEPYDGQLPTTHGIEIGTLDLTHPEHDDVTMQLNTWDFGGQEIYHATHQFFLTNRSLFLLVWNARQGFEQGKLYYWLDTIQARAPESPVLIVATHIDERDADIPLGDLRRKYPQIVGHCAVSNLDGTGIENLRDAMASAAAGLPLMGETWPANWLDAAEAVRAREERHISPRQLHDVMTEHDVTGDSAATLAQWLHELGDILYFRDREDLKDTVILKPQWVTEYISKVLESEQVIEGVGIFTRRHMEQLWTGVDPSMQEHFLRLMEQFDLSYRIPDDPRDRSLIVERLSFEPPDYRSKWDGIWYREPCSEITMKFNLNTTMPAGVPTWFIARSHRFTTYNHWRCGALFADQREPRHLGLIQAFPHDRYLQLSVRGPCPHNFFALLRDGLELTLARFPGMKVERLVPCPGHDGEACPHEFELAHLEKAIARKPPVGEIQCPEGLELVSVPLLLFGIDWPGASVPSPPYATLEAVLARLDRIEGAVAEGKDEILASLSELRELSQREFTNIFRREQSKLESHCPNVFTLRPVGSTGWRKKLVGQKMELQLYCQAPGCWHPTVKGGRYEITVPAGWLTVMAPYIRRLISVMKYAAPLVGPSIGMADADSKEMFKNNIELMNELVERLPEIEDPAELRRTDVLGYADDPDCAEGAALRALRQLLDEKDPGHGWGGLKKKLTPEGHYLWLCEEHAREYAR